MTYFHNPEDSLEIFQYPDEAVLQLHPQSLHSPGEEQTSQCLLQKVYFLLKLRNFADCKLKDILAIHGNVFCF